MVKWDGKWKRGKGKRGKGKRGKGKRGKGKRGEGKGKGDRASDGESWQREKEER